MRASLDYLANIFKFGLSLVPVSHHVVHVIVRLGFGEPVLELLFLRPCKLEMVSAKLDSAEFRVRPVVTQIPGLYTQST